MKSTKDLPLSYRIILGIFAVVNIPLALFGMVWIFTLPVVIPGLVLLVWYWKAWTNPTPVTQLRTMWIGTIGYNIALMLGLIVIYREQMTVAWPALGYLVPIGMSLVALEAIPESEEETTGRAKIKMNWENEIQAESDQVTARDLVEL